MLLMGHFIIHRFEGKNSWRMYVWFEEHQDIKTLFQLLSTYNCRLLYL